ncbi:MAG: hypothetical protein M1600_10625 [Firmicutes bacterium]|nr:hypothetical protein [Bacillota bacterium]
MVQLTRRTATMPSIRGFGGYAGSLRWVIDGQFPSITHVVLGYCLVRTQPASGRPAPSETPFGTAPRLAQGRLPQYW